MLLFSAELTKMGNYIRTDQYLGRWTGVHFADPQLCIIHVFIFTSEILHLEQLKEQTSILM